MSGRKFKPGETVDFAVVGSGAAGGVIARELALAGFSIVVLEQGPRLSPADFEHDELKYAYLHGIINRKVEWEVGVSGLAGASPFEPPRTRPYPMPPLPVKSSGVLLERGARKLGLHPFPAPMAIVSQAYRGRPACVSCGFCMGFGCEVMAKSSVL
jgi:choline dehydrogenase-like flavoprotein